MIEALVISGPAGVGKSSTAFEVSARLRALDVAHAVIDTDALDDIHPRPLDQWRLTERNLACVWRGFREHGARRAILAGVYLHRPSELAWLRRAIAADRLTVVALTATEQTLTARIGAREIGSVHDDQLARTLRQARELACEPPTDAHTFATDGEPVTATAARIVSLLGWH